MLVYVAGAYRGKSKNKLINRLQVMRNIYREMLKKCDGIVMLPGWVYSAGAVREYMVAIDRGMKVMYWDEMEGLRC